MIGYFLLFIYLLGVVGFASRLDVQGATWKSCAWMTVLLLLWPLYPLFVVFFLILGKVRS